jgi:predicted DNA-binding transcriptional regulator AlpA
MQNSLKTPDAAKLLGLSASTLEKYRIDGSGPKFVRLGRAIRYRPSDLNAFLEDNVRISTSDTGQVR